MKNVLWLIIFITILCLCGYKTTKSIEADAVSYKISKSEVQPVEMIPAGSVAALSPAPVKIVQEVVNKPKYISATWEKFINKLYANNNKEYNKTIIVLAKTLYGEGGKGETNKAAVVWCVLNRVDRAKGERTIIQIATKPHQFAYRKRAPVKDYLKKLAKDVLNRWIAEKQCQKDIGRVLPEYYHYFTGNGTYNVFRKFYRKPGQERLTPKHSQVYSD